AVARRGHRGLESSGSATPHADRGAREGGRPLRLLGSPGERSPCSWTPAGPRYQARCGTEARPRRSFGRWPRGARLAFGAREHGLRPRCLRFVLRVAPADARLASGCWPALPGGMGYPQGSDERFPLALPPFPTYPDARTTNLSSGGGRRLLVCSIWLPTP